MIAGLSAGGAMAMVMGATYPELYQSIGVHSGLPYKSASDIPSALSTMAGNQRFIDTRAGSFPRTIIFHGSDDKTVKSHNASNLWRQALGGQKLDEVQVEQFVSGSRIVRRQIRRDADQRSSAELWMIEGAGHCWSGGNTLGSYADSEGPNASEEMIRFLLRKPTNNEVGFFE